MMDRMLTVVFASSITKIIDQTMTSVDSNGHTSWQVPSGCDILQKMLNICIVRRAADRTSLLSERPENYDELCEAPHGVEFVFPSDRDEELYLSKPPLTVGGIVNLMKLNWSSTDMGTELTREIIASVPYKKKFLTSYILTQFSGRAFLKTLSEHGVEGSTVLDVLRKALQRMHDNNEHFADCYTTGFNPQRRFRNEARKMDMQEFLQLDTLKHKFLIQPRPTPVKLRHLDGSWRHKRAIMLDAKDLYGFGPFKTKNWWQIYTAGKKTVPTDLDYCEIGPGAKCFLLTWKRYPNRLLLQSPNQESADFFNILLKELRVAWRKLLRREIQKASVEGKQQLAQLLRKIQQETTATLEDLQFFCCENTKVLRFIVTRSAMYLRVSQGAGADDPDLDEDN